MSKPRLSFGEIFNMSFGLGLQLANTSAIDNKRAGRLPIPPDPVLLLLA